MFWSQPTPPSTDHHLVVRTETPAIRCVVCHQQAYGLNYGVVACNACKMFFRRVSILEPGYVCKEMRRCYRNIEFRVQNGETRPKCRACRFARCVDVGMRYVKTADEARIIEARGHIERMSSPMGSSLSTIVRNLLQLDSTRSLHFETMRTDEDPSMEDLILRTARWRLALDDNRPEPSPMPQVLSEWSFLGIWTSVEFHNNLDFMASLETGDKMVLLKNFAIKSYLLSSAFRCSRQKSESLVNPDGTQLFPSNLTEISQFSANYVERIQKWLVSRLTKLGVTSEEYILATVVLFCNPALSGLSQNAQKIVAEQQQRHGKALFEYSMLTWNAKGPQRFQEIVSLGNVVEKCFEDVKTLVDILRLFYPHAYNYKKLFMESLNKDES